MVFQKKTSSDGEVEHILSGDFYMHKAIMNAMTAPIKALESENERFNDGLVSVQLSVFLLEKFAWAEGTLHDSEPEMDAFVQKEKEKMLSEGITDLDKNERAKARLAYAKLAWIYRQIHIGKPSNTEYKV